MQKAINLEKTYQDRCKKTLQYGNVEAVFPSFGLHVDGQYDTEAIVETNSIYLTSAAVPVSSAATTRRVLSKLPEEKQDEVYNSTPLLIDFETENWYWQSKAVKEVKKPFLQIDDLPGDAKELFTTPKDNPTRSYEAHYRHKLDTVLGSRENRIKLTLATMRFGVEEMTSPLPLPLAPMIIGNDASLEYCFQMNEFYNKYKGHFGLFQVAYYPLHPSALKSSVVRKRIRKHVYKLDPDVVYIGTIDSHKYLNKSSDDFNPQGAHFEKLMEDLALYARTNNTIVGWYDKGNYAAPKGIQMIKEGIDSIIFPLKGHYINGGSGGPSYANVLTEGGYKDWEEFLQDEDQHYLNGESPEKLRKLSYPEQWKYKRKRDINFRNEQFNHIHEKLEEDGSLKDFDARIKRNGVSRFRR